jgi:ribosome maturation factor RimP
MAYRDVLSRVETLVQPILDDCGYELVDLQYKSEGSRMALRLLIDKPGGITLDDCVSVSREVGAILEIEDPIRGAYRLEVSSPGLDRPLRKRADFERFAGSKAKLKTLSMLDPDDRGRARKTFTGELLGLEGEAVKLQLDDKQGGVALIALSEIERASLIEEL